jgi:hypothetical protein
MIHDTVVDEVRAIRDEIAKEHDYDIDSIFEALRDAEKASGVGHVTLEARRTAEQHAATDRASPGR